jgi:hypothetical protein
MRHHERLQLTATTLRRTLPFGMSVLALGFYLGSPWLLPRTVQAVDSPIGFELYSWQNGAHWSFAVLDGTSTVRSAEAIRTRKTALKNLTYLKGRLASLPAGEIVYWREDRARGFRLPTRETIEDLKRFSEGNQITIVLPEDAREP